MAFTACTAEVLSGVNESGKIEGIGIEKSGEHNSPKECSPLTQDQPTGTANRKIERVHAATCSDWTQLTGSAGNRLFVTQLPKIVFGAANSREFASVCSQRCYDSV